MKIIYEANVTSNLLLMDDSKPKGDPQYQSCVQWSDGKYSTKSLYVGVKLPLGQKMWVIVQDTDPSYCTEFESASGDDAVCDNCGRPASEHSGGADEFSHCPSVTS